MLSRLLKCVREYKTISILSCIFISGEVFIEVFIPFLVADMINAIKSGAAMEEILQTGIKLVIMAVLSLFCGSIAAILSAKASTGFAKNLRHDLFAKIQGFSFANIDRFSTSSLVTRLTTDVTNVQQSYMMIIRTAIRSPLMFVFSVIMAYRMGGALSLSFVVVIPILICGLFLISRNAMPAFRKVFKKYDKLNESVEENVRGMRVVKGFVREAYEKKKFAAAADDITNDFTKAERIVAFNSPIMQFCMYFNTVFILFIGSYLIIKNGGTTIDVGQISSMLTYGMQILMSLMMISMFYVMITMSIESIRRIDEVLCEEPTINNCENPIADVKDGSIRFNNVSFKYSKNATRNALEGINLNISSGMTVGILGGTGSSKTTLVQLIPRLYDVTEGSVEIGGIDVRNYDIETLRDNVAMVLQKNELFSGTIKDNLRWGNENATEEEIVDVCKLAQAHEFISTFPDGYDTHIEQGGTNVSGGQKQRLCIARALLKKPKILILDDSTSAVDTKTDALIRKGFKEYIPDTTKIIIAQRVNSVEDADMIIVMDNGQIAGIGTHDELLLNNNIYKEVYEQQKLGGEDNEQ
ncbi:MAG: ABC transporter ATP-binding protein [Clostridia bacterium]|nr:ABC transporter ATP-binding protein [Clostridia bacterium]